MDDGMPIIPTMINDAISLAILNQQQLEKKKKIPPKLIAFVDVETTGLDPKKDEVLQVSICNGDGTILLSSYVRPATRKRWPNAQKINGITWSMVKDMPTLIDFSRAIESIFDDCLLLVGYNLEFDLNMLYVGRVNIPRNIKVYDLMNDVSIVHGKWSDYHGNYSFISLSKAAKIYGIEFDAHNAENDVIATEKLYYAFLNGQALNEKLSNKQAKSKPGNSKRTNTTKVATSKTAQPKKKISHDMSVAIRVLVITAVILLLLVSCVRACSGI